MVGGEGLEPSRPKGHKILSLARMPIPPPAQTTKYNTILIRKRHFGARGGSRTPDLFLRRELLYPLSYSGSGAADRIRTGDLLLGRETF